MASTNTLVTIEAKPEPTTIDLARTAVIVVDMQNDFGAEGHILIRDTWNTQMVCELEPEPGDIVVSKHRFSGFYGTDLEMILRGLLIQYLVFTGGTTSVCVESTMRDAMFRDFRCVLLADCTAEPIGQGLSRSNHDASLFILQRVFGWISDSAHFFGALDSQPMVSQKPT